MAAMWPCTSRDFYPRSPCGERLPTDGLFFLDKRFLSTLSLRRATANNRAEQQAQRISIHALLAESDMIHMQKFCVSTFLSTLSLRRATGGERVSQSRYCISIHALLAESDAFRSPRIALMVGFLSTLSLRRATAAIGKPTLEIAYFYPRSPCGERPNPSRRRRLW